MTLLEKLMQHSIELENGCIEWHGYRPARRNHGLIRTNKTKQEKVQNVMYRLSYGPIPKGFMVSNSCGNNYCINKEHLILVKRNQQWKKDPIERLHANTVKTDSGCWEWVGTKTKFGHGQFVIDGKVEAVHRFAYRSFVGPIPDGLFVCHKCDNPPCWNPDHLYLGTAQDNVRDRKVRGRNAPKYGTHNGRSILTDADVMKIRRLFSCDNITKSELARQFRVSFNTISRIVKNENWKHVRSGGANNDGR